MPIPDQSSPEDTAWNFTLPPTAFAGAIGGLGLTATLADGGALPAWLSFDVNTGTFTGMPPRDFAGTVGIRVVAGDGPLAQSTAFTLTITPVDDAPVLAARPIYRQDFEGVADADGWFEVTERGDIRDPVRRIVEDGEARAVSTGGWWPDPNHIAPGGGWLNLVMMRDATDLPIGDFTDLVFTFTIDLDDLHLPQGAGVYAFFQSQDHHIPWGAGNYVNYLNTANPITRSGTYSIRFSTDDADWLPLGSSFARRDTYGVSASVADALGGTPVDFGLVILRGDADPTRPLSGTVAVDDIALERAGPPRASVDAALPLDLQPLGLQLAFTDVDNQTFDALTLTVTDAQPASGAAIGLADAPAAGLTVTADAVAVDGVVVAAQAGGRDGAPLVIAFVDGVTAPIVERVLSALAFAPGDGPLPDLRLLLEDASGGTTAFDVTVRTDHGLYNGSGDDQVTGDEQGNALRGGAGDDRIDGLGGDDRLAGGEGNDALLGGGGQDTLYGDAGHDRLDGGTGDDTLIGDAGSDILAGGAGDDALYVDDPGDSVEELAGEGNDRLYASTSYLLAADAHVETLSAYDTGAAGGIDLTGNAFGNLLLGDAGANRLDAGEGDDALYGLDGDDVLIGGTGSDTLTGGTGIDRLDGGAGSDTLLGNEGADTLFGGDGRDQLVGGAGDDVLAGGTGDDDHYVDQAGDRIEEFAGEGNDRVFATASYTLGDDVHVETLSTYDARTTDAIDLTGNGLNNLLLGNAGANRLAGGAGDDMLYGFDGSDALAGGAGDDALAGGAGADRLDGGAGNDTLLGDDGRDTLFGGDGADQLVGGAGADTMVGGAGNDSFYVDDPADQIVEEDGEGQDRIYATASYALAANVHVETVSAYDAHAPDAIGFTGNASANLLIGNAGANRLDGGAGDDVLQGLDGDDTLIGGDGGDVLIGGMGDDTHVVADPGDVVIERPGEGTDTVVSSIDHVLGNAVENLTLGGMASAGVGNDLDNQIAGNAAANVLQGRAGHDILDGGEGQDRLDGGDGNDVLAGGAGGDVLDGGSGSDQLDGGLGNDRLDGGSGADTLAGGLGDDSYHIDDAGDVIVERTGAGNDRIHATASYVLARNISIETLSASDAPATAAIDLTGNTFANLLQGHAGANRLDGDGGNDTLHGLDGDDTLIGGAGNDTLVGGSGADTFVFAPTPRGGIDTVDDFTGGVDRIAFEAAAVQLDRDTAFAGALRIGGTVAVGADDRVIYDPLTGALLFDPDGSGDLAPAVQFAWITPGTALTAADFVVI